MKNPLSSSIKLALVFLVFGVAWILGSDLLLLSVTRGDLDLYSQLQHWKGILFMVLAALLIYFVSRRLNASIEAARRHRDEMQNRYNTLSMTTNDTVCALQRQLAEEQSRHEKEMAQGILQAEEAERKKLGEELHDNINQLLGVVKLYLQHAQKNKQARQELLVKCSDYISETIEEIRNLSRSLLPPSLQDYGLLVNLYQLIADIRQAKNINIDLIADVFEENKVPANLQLMLYRIIQEQLNNVLKHSGANEVVIELRYQHELVQLQISDNGSGFDPEKTKSGIGFNNIRNRLNLVNGKMQINTAPDKGCTLLVSFVLPYTVPGSPIPFRTS